METPEQPKPLSKVRQEFILSYYAEYHKELGKKCPETFVKCLGSLKTVFEGLDEDTGEIILCYPTQEEWNEELHKFFYRSKDNWYRNNNRNTFYTFCKNYGRYDHHIPPVQQAPTQYKSATVKLTRVMIACSDCGKNHYSDEYCQ